MYSLMKISALKDQKGKSKHFRLCTVVKNGSENMQKLILPLNFHTEFFWDLHEFFGRR